MLLIHVDGAGKAWILAKGNRSPYCPTGPATLIVAPPMLAVILNLPQCGPEEVQHLETERVDVAFEREGCTGFLIWRFGGNGPRIAHFETPFHSGEQDPRDFDCFDGRANRSRVGDVGLLVLIQDETRMLRGTRWVQLPPDVLREINRTVADQKLDLARPGFRLRHRRDIGRFQFRMPRLGHAFSSHSVQGCASMRIM